MAPRSVISTRRKKHFPRVSLQKKETKQLYKTKKTSYSSLFRHIFLSHDVAWTSIYRCVLFGHIKKVEIDTKPHSLKKERERALADVAQRLSASL